MHEQDSMEPPLSNKDKGDKNLDELSEWLSTTSSIPERYGKANISAIALASGVDRQVLYRPEAREMIRKAVSEKGLGMPEQAARAGAAELPPWAKQKIHELEQRITTLYAELGDARRKLARFEHMERHMTQTGMLPR